MRIFFLLLVFGFYSFIIKAQEPLSKPPNLGSEPSIQSPTSNNLGKYGEIPVSLFTGTPTISIPLTDIECGEIKIPIDLQYDASGCRPDQHPGWVGLNWSLRAGGVIKRHTNGYFDEYVYLDPERGAYYNNYDVLSAPDWNTVEFLEDNSHLAFDGGVYEPDEFSFSFNGISGSFMWNHEGKWVVKSKENLNIKVEHITENNYLLNSSSQVVPRAFTKFILTTNDGTQYIFGGDKNAIEFSRPSLPFRIEPYNLKGPPGPDNTSIRYESKHEINRNIQSSAWLLTEVISPTGRSVKLYYTTSASLQQATYSEIGSMISPVNALGRIYTYDINQNNKYYINSSYLDRIETDNDVVCHFSKSLSNELVQDLKFKPFSQDGFPYDDYAMLNIKYYKLNSLQINSGNKPIKKILLNYIENSSERLKLKEVKISHLGGISSEDYKYTLEYSPKKLPTYNSGQEDHWGYYNGKNYWNGESKQEVTEIPNLEGYYESREPDSAYMGAEILTKLYYPTGGFSKFLFEPHDYAKVIDYNPTIHLETQQSNTMAGGLRIKKIETYDYTSSVPLVQEYFYAKDYINGGTTSSGVLAGKPIYYEEGNGLHGSSFRKFSSLPLNYLNTTNGNHITYTEVTEKNKEGYITHAYTNHDNGYMDKEPFAQTNEAESSKYAKKFFGKLDLERGLPLSTKYYDKTKFLIKSLTNQYNSNPNRYNSYVRSVGGVGNIYIFSVSRVAYPLYSFYPYLEKQTIKEYFKNGEEVSAVVSYKYNSKQLVNEIQETNSKDEILTTKYTYPFNLTSSNLYREMTNKNMLDYKVIEEQLKGNKKIKHIKTDYKDWEDNLILSGQIQVSKEGDEVEDFIVYHNYDRYGNPSEISKNAGPHSAYLWGYEGRYPIAKCITPNDASGLKVSVNSYPLKKEAYATGGTVGSGGSLGSFTLERSGSVTVYIEELNIQDFTNDATLSIVMDVLQGNNIAKSLNFSFNYYASSGNWMPSPGGDQFSVSLPAGNYSLKFNPSGSSFLYNGSTSMGLPNFTFNGSIRYRHRVTEEVAGKFFHTSFEDDITANPVYAYTGKKSHYGTYEMSLVASGAGDYVLEYWMYNVSTKSWERNEELASITSSGNFTKTIGQSNRYIDEIRLYPSNAQITTYTYDPLIGMTSMTDASGRVTTYNYDDFNRLEFVRDERGKLIQENKYHYKN
ncbi:RHS repeat domain-containing protein [Sinomicrobium sp. M5D2P9]